MAATQRGDGVNVAITNDLARIVGLVAEKHRDCAIEIRWTEGSAESRWTITATNGVEDHVYIADDEDGEWCPLQPDEDPAALGLAH